MIPRSATTSLIAVLAALPLLAVAAPRARADGPAATACAAQLPRDAQAIFSATLPQLGPNADLRALVTANTRALASSGTIDRGGARDSAMSAAKCLRLAGS